MCGSTHWIADQQSDQVRRRWTGCGWKERRLVVCRCFRQSFQDLVVMHRSVPYCITVGDNARLPALASKIRDHELQTGWCNAKASILYSWLEGFSGEQKGPLALLSGHLPGGE
jgi:hypothetical protein